MDDVAVGTLGVGCRAPRDFSPAETELLQHVGAAIAKATAVGNA